MWTRRAVVSLWIAALLGVALLIAGASQALLPGAPPSTDLGQFVRSAEAVPVAAALGGALAIAVFGGILLVGHVGRRW